ncbi:MAG: DUF3071 domain-containing protein [Gordonia sp.]|uniref:septation protein SepH n=1 Tax=Gordonia sp. (in: high G+C Gram-positive bacteria) TaxID=84139 RepID=UPI001D9F25D2|nr:septation protein SepH [Gordonia sp. (in: high G+C Gram-positive bacteria)]MCB1294792.1 DUF3071 domain-containing protein [Gordonia sp. (in: high G+C Gram-positive bacteria)]
MRELRVVGVDTDGKRVICQDPDTTERFAIVADERLRAAARGDLSRLGQIQIEMESSLRPREIQARIRGGASVAEVAAIAGVTIERIERFAHPVLLERQRATELAAQSHPLREDGPSKSTLSEAVAEAFSAFGYSSTEIDWDAWKGDDGEWVIQLMWLVGHTDFYAHWRYRPGSHGGITDPLDELAYEITHPELITPRPRLSPVVVGQSAQPDTLPAAFADQPQQVSPDPAAPIVPLVADVAAHDDAYPEPGPMGGDGVTGGAAPDITDSEDHEEPVHDALQDDDRHDAAHRDTAHQDAAHQDPAHHDDAHSNDVAVKPRRRSRTPSVPAWEDVLLGVRGNGHS